jgi:hypothetical protein
VVTAVVTGNEMSIEQITDIFNIKEVSVIFYSPPFIINLHISELKFTKLSSKQIKLVLLKHILIQRKTFQYGHIKEKNKIINLIMFTLPNVNCFFTPEVGE